jgi:hypothetical protein
MADLLNDDMWMDMAVQRYMRNDDVEMAGPGGTEN